MGNFERHDSSTSNVSAHAARSFKSRGSRMSARFGATAAVVVVSLLLTSCAGSVAPLPAPPEVSVLPTSSSVPDYSDVSLQKVDGRTLVESNPAVQGGNATISGVVKVGGTPAANAVVHLERYVDKKSQRLDVRTDDQGRYSASNIQGGRYSVRAYRAPDAYSEKSQTFFLGGKEKRNLDFNLTSTSGRTSVNWVIAPNPPYLGRTANVVVSMTQSAVGDDGVARSSGVSGVELRLESDGGRPVVSSATTSTNSAGRASWQIRCDSRSNQGLTVFYSDGRSERVNLAACEPPPTTTTTTVASDGDDDAGSLDVGQDDEGR